MRFPRFEMAILLALVLLVGCADDGSVINPCDNPELSCDDGNACTIDGCDEEIGCRHEWLICDDADACTTDRCDTSLGCVHGAVTCNDTNACTSDVCDSARGCLFNDISASCVDASVCTTDRCDPATGCVNAPIDCDDDNPCTAESCDAVSGCASQVVTDGTRCNSGLGSCQSGVCEPLGCASDGECNDGNACTQDRCDSARNECINTDISASCNDDDACTADRCDTELGCVNQDISATCDDEDECTADLCSAATGCNHPPVPDGTTCDGGDGACRAGTCVSLSQVEYDQDFEGLDRANPNALADDGWVVYGNVYDGTSGTFVYGYGPFLAPNDGAAFSALVDGQGGPEQGSFQLSVYSDYNNRDHANRQSIESIFYRERSITAADVGRTIVFRFDGKRGNINDPSDALCPCTTTALAFVKTLDPAAGYATTNNVTRNTTDLPETWARYEVSLAIGPTLVGQLLQVGFANTATLYQPSGVLYDNVEVRSAPTVLPAGAN